MNNIIVPGSGLELPPSMQMKDRESIGPVTVGDQVPWRGLVFRVSKIFGNDHNDFFMVLAPVTLTKGRIKRLTGTKGKRNRKKTKKAVRALRGIPTDSSSTV
jgi:hypothetical protein